MSYAIGADDFAAQAARLAVRSNASTSARILIFSFVFPLSVLFSCLYRREIHADVAEMEENFFKVVCVQTQPEAARQQSSASASSAHGSAVVTETS